MSLLSQESISYISNFVTIIGLPIAIVGLAAAAWQMRNERLAVSAGAIGAMRVSLLGRIERIEQTKLDGNVPKWSDEFKELLNEIEMACAIYLDGQMSGRTGELAKCVVCDLLEMINEDPDLREELEQAIHAPDTFRNIRDFREKVKRNA
ncbi:hypothetical protein J2046_006785 [Rhizobium petrolearium]|uniref:hypothetical protein n=1 Tax=Neorhizobium petrolearium TaxID=515361 RepID=UPI001F4264A3|nr:hypothetical protein [Neorhizobium petrolearium]MBP1848489.1 hypothetical protein [Neorhizobium petrolearium]